MFRGRFLFVAGVVVTLLAAVALGPGTLAAAGTVVPSDIGTTGGSEAADTTTVNEVSIAERTDHDRHDGEVLERSPSDSGGQLDENLTNATGEVTVVVRFEHEELAGIAETDSDPVEQLQTAAEASQREFRESYGDAGAVRTQEDSPVVIEREFWLANAMVVTVDTDRVPVEAFLETEGVRDVHENFELRLDGTAVGDGEAGVYSSAGTTDPVEATGDKTTYGLELINAPDVWETFETRGEGTTVAVLDTGADPDHEDVDVEAWAEFDVFGNLVSDDPADAYDNNDHGTHVAGTVAGGDASGTAIGVAPEADLHAIKVLNDDGTGSFAQIIAGMEHAIEDDDVDILQLSLGVDGQQDEMIEPVRNARGAGQLVVASVGNDGDGQSGSPGNVYDSVSVGAVDSSSDVASFSGGEEIAREDWDDSPSEWPETYVVPSVTAPGVGVESAAIDSGDGTTAKSGTSMAAPHVSGAAALVLSAVDDEGLEDDELVDLLEETAVHPDGEREPDTRYGYGVIDAYGAVDTALEEFEGEATIRGTVTDDSEDPIEGATVESDVEGTPTAETDADGEYELETVFGEQTISVEAFGWNRTEKEGVQGGDAGVDFELDDPVVAAERTGDATDRLDPVDNDTITFRVANLKGYNASLTDESETIDGETVNTNDIDLKVNGSDAAVDERTAFARPNTTDEFTVTVDPDDDINLSRIQLEHEFDGPGENVSETTRTTKIHPDRVQAGDDRNLSDLIDFVVAGTTIVVDEDRTETATDDGAAVELDREVTLAGSATLAIENETDDRDAIGINVTSEFASVENLSVDGEEGLDVGVHVGYGRTPGLGTDVTPDVDNVTVRNATVGIRTLEARGIAGSTIEDVTDGIVLEKSTLRVWNTTIAPDEHGIVANASSTLENNTIVGGTTGMGIDAAGVDGADNDVDGATTGLSVLEGADGTTLTETAFDGTVGTAILFDGATNSDLTASAANESSTVEYRNVDLEDDNALEIELANGRQIGTVGQNVTVAQDTNPPAADDQFPIDANLSIEETESETGEINLEVFYTPKDFVSIFEESFGLYNHDGDEWSELKEVELDSDNRTLSTTIESFSSFSAAGSEEGGTINGTVTDTITGDPIEGIDVTADNGSTEITRWTNETGEYVISVPIHDETFYVTAGLENASYDPSATVKTEKFYSGGQNDTVDLETRLSNATVEGTITAADTGESLEGVTVEAETEDGHRVANTTDVDGQYELSLFPSAYNGSYTLNASIADFDEKTVFEDREFDAAAEETEDVALEPKPGTIEGTVTDSKNGSGIAAATVSADGEETTTDADGHYELSDLDRGDRTVIVEADGYNGTTRSVSLPANATITEDVALERVPVYTIDAVDLPDSVEQGETLSGTATVRNAGLANGTGTITLELSALGLSDAASIDLEPEAEAGVDLSVSIPSSASTGEYEATISSEDDTADALVDVTTASSDDSGGGGGGQGGGGQGGGGGGGGSGSTGDDGPPSFDNIRGTLTLVTPSSQSSTPIEDSDPDTPGTVVVTTDAHGVEQVHFTADDLTGTIDITEYDRPPRRIRNDVTASIEADIDRFEDDPFEIVSFSEMSSSLSARDDSSATVTFDLEADSVEEPDQLTTIKETWSFSRQQWEWQEKPTTVEDTDDETITVSVDVNSFSFFVLAETEGEPTPIDSDDEPAPEPEDELPEDELSEDADTDDGIPGFGLAVTILAVLIAVGWTARRH